MKVVFEKDRARIVKYDKIVAVGKRVNNLYVVSFKLYHPKSYNVDSIDYGIGGTVIVVTITWKD